MLEGSPYTGYPAFNYNPKLATALKNAVAGGILNGGTLNYANTIIANSSGGDCSLREAIVAANANSGADTIRFD
ncbi:MAG: hypothetical protein ACJ8CR_23635, partial [Roseiflexaceae bacterium]